jgi:PAS domain S-box-containing protein
MQNTILDYLVPIAISAIFVFIWRARHQPFALIGNCWPKILLGFAFLMLGEVLNLTISGLVEYAYLAEAAGQRYVLSADVATFAGLAVVAQGVYRWLKGTQQLELDWATALERNDLLRQRVSRDGMLLSTVPAALYRTYGVASQRSSESVFVNDKIEDLLGYSATEFEQDPKLFGSLMHPDDRRRFEEVERADLWNHNSIVIEHRFRHRDGNYRWLRRHLVRISDNDDLAEWHGCAFDISDLKRAESRLANFLEAAPDPVITTNDQGVIVLVNAQAERLFGYSKAELLGQFVHSLIPDNDSDGRELRLVDYLGESNLPQSGTGLDTRGRHKDQREFPIEISVSPIENGNERLFAFAIRDISARMNIEAQLRQSQKMEAVGQLTGGIAHDFNNLLTIVIGNLQLLERDSDLDDDARSATSAAMDASIRAAELVKRLLAYSRRQKLEPKNTNINNLVDGIGSMLQRSISESVTLKTKLAEELWTARIDATQLETTLLNLAINARDALRSGGIVSIETSNTVLDHSYAERNREVTPGDYVLIAVSDNGEGIPKDVLPHVFEPFYSTKEVGKGSGLGLSMVYGFVKQSQGHIKVYSEEGHGTTIKIYIPRCSSEAKTASQSIVTSFPAPDGKETILLVEDDENVREIASSLLSSMGYQVLQAESGRAALQILAKRDDIDLLFTDMVMPGGMTGAELANQALGVHPQLKVLYTSGYTDMSIFDNGLLQSGSNVLSKPYRKDELAHLVRDTLDRVH